MILEIEKLAHADGLPEWVQIIGFLVVTTLGAGFGAPLITGWLNRKKLSADAASVDATAGLTSAQTAEHVLNMVRTELDKALARITSLEESNQRLAEELRTLRNSTAQETSTLREQLREAQDTNTLLRQFIAEISRKWATLTTEPFTDYDTWRNSR